MLIDFTQSEAERLSATLPGLSLKQAAPRYLEEPRGKWRGRPGFVAAPRTTDEVAAILRHANARCFGIQPYGGGTGLVGGQLSTDGPLPLILSLENMAAIRVIHRQENTLVAEAGATLEAIHTAAADAHRLFPLTYGSKGTAQIGAGLSVNSGGLNVLRYGMARDLCLGIEAVLPSGDILHGLKRLRKDNTGYDLRHLLIGAEGTLGIITAAALKLAPIPARTATAFLAVRDPAAALDLLSRLLDTAGEVVSAFELIAGEGLDFLTETHPDTRQPFADRPRWSVLVELGTGTTTDPQTLLETLFSEAFDAGLVSDGTIAASGQQRDAFWAVRETIPEANRTLGSIASHDISLPLSDIPAFLDEMTPRICALGPLRVNAFGHLGDGNLHYNVFAEKGGRPADLKYLAPEITRLIHDRVCDLGGSFSAEHGIGRLKTDDLARYGDPAKIATMRAIKAALDPNGIMNPGAVLKQKDPAN